MLLIKLTKTTITGDLPFVTESRNGRWLVQPARLSHMDLVSDQGPYRANETAVPGARGVYILPNTEWRRKIGPHRTLELSKSPSLSLSFPLQFRQTLQPYNPLFQRRRLSFSCCYTHIRVYSVYLHRILQNTPGKYLFLRSLLCNSSRLPHTLS